MSKRKYETTADNAQDTPVKKVPGGWKIDDPLELTQGLTVSGGSVSIGGVLIDPSEISEIVVSATGSLNAEQMAGGIANNYGQTTANTQTLPTCAANLRKTFVISAQGVGAFNLKAGPDDKIILDGVTLDDGDKVTNATPFVGDTLAVYSFQSGTATYDWICFSGQGTWLDGGA